MIALDYNTGIRHQYQEVNRNRKTFYWLSPVNFFHFIKKILHKNLSSLLNSQLIFSSGLIAQLNEQTDLLKDRDLSNAIKSMDDLIKINIILKSEIEKINDPELENAFNLLSEIIDNYYTVLRLLKRNTKKKQIETSQLAIDSCRHSLNSLQTITNGRRTT